MHDDFLVRRRWNHGHSAGRAAGGGYGILPLKYCKFVEEKCDADGENIMKNKQCEELDVQNGDIKENAGEIDIMEDPLECMDQGNDD